MTAKKATKSTALILAKKPVAKARKSPRLPIVDFRKLPDDAICFMVDGIIPCRTFRDAKFLADAIADFNNRPVEIRRTVRFKGTKLPDVYVRHPHSPGERDEIYAGDDNIVVSGDRVVFSGSRGECYAFQKAYRGGKVCSVSHTREEDKDRELKEIDNLKRKAEYRGFKLVKVA